jgi:dethiobiotin synthetase
VDLAKAIGLPVVLVVGLRLGCLNHACSRARRSRRAGSSSRGWIANDIASGMAARDENIAALRTRIHAPLLGTLAYMDPPESAAACRISRHPHADRAMTTFLFDLDGTLTDPR